MFEFGSHELFFDFEYENLTIGSEAVRLKRTLRTSCALAASFFVQGYSTQGSSNEVRHTTKIGFR